MSIIATECAINHRPAHQGMIVIKVDVITAIHNAEATLKETVRSAMHQEIPPKLIHRLILLPQQQLHPDFSPNTRKRRIHFDICVCCYDDASTDRSMEVLDSLEKETNWEISDATATTNDATERKIITIQTRLLIGSAPTGTPSRGAGYARNQAVKLRDDYDRENSAHKNSDTITEGQDHVQYHFLCILDSDDIMHSTRIAEQSYAMLSLDAELRDKTLLGCQFDRIPKDSTHHYSEWANSLSDERLYLEKFRECTLIQPTWFLPKAWFERVGGYLEAPMSDDNIHSSKRHKLYSYSLKPGDDIGISILDSDRSSCHSYCLVHSSEVLDSAINNDLQPCEKRKPSACHTQAVNTLRLAEDTRFFYAHLHAGGKLLLHRTPIPLVSYRHRAGMSQSSSTPRKLLLKLRTKAWEDLIFYSSLSGGACNNTIWSSGFVIWGAGRDGKDFLKALGPEVASKVVCFVDVDQKKIETIKWYENPAMGGRRIPILHFSVLAKEDISDEGKFGHIDKKRCCEDQFSLVSKQRIESNDRISCQRGKKMTKTKTKSETSIDPEILHELPVVVCVAMYRSNGALESNVASIGRVEGVDLWHLI